MTWDAFHHRGDVLRSVAHETGLRRDGALPMELPGVAETFGDEFALVAALQLRWHTRLAGRIERNLMDQPEDPETAVLSAWRETAAELVGIRLVLDAQRETPAVPELAGVLEKAHRKDAALMAAMAGQAAPFDPRAVAVGERLERAARAAYWPTVASDSAPDSAPEPTFIGRILAHLSAA